MRIEVGIHRGRRSHRTRIRVALREASDARIIRPRPQVDETLVVGGFCCVTELQQAGRRDLILLVYEGVNLTPEKLVDVPGEVLYFKKKPILKDVMAAVEAVTG